MNRQVLGSEDSLWLLSEELSEIRHDTAKELLIDPNLPSAHPCFEG